MAGTFQDEGHQTFPIPTQLRIGRGRYRLPAWHRRMTAMKTERPPLRRCRRLLGGVIPLIALLLAAPAAAPETPDDPERAEARLKEVRQRIKAISDRIAADRRQRDQLAAALHQAERQISELSAELARIDAQLEVKQNHLKSLRKNRRARRSSVIAQRKELERHIRAAYMLGRQDRLKLLLNQQEPAAVSRAFTYYEYFNRARARRIQALREEIGALAEIEAGIREQTAELEALKTRKSRARADVETQHEKRREAVSMLSSRIERAGSQIARLKEDERRLTALVKKLEEEFAELAVPTEFQQIRFPKLKGKLPWPISGKIRHRFGAPREGGDLKWRGVVISANRGEPVRAISYGRVAFADWLRGFGFLVILDHGDGYMSLYGYAQSLIREVGDWVQRGETIAVVGDSGGQEETALYFEIRQNGVPSNPAGWCSDAATATLVSP